MTSSDYQSFCAKRFVYRTLFYHQSHEVDNFLSPLTLTIKKKAIVFKVNCTKSRRQWQSQHKSRLFGFVTLNQPGWCLVIGII